MVVRHRGSDGEPFWGCNNYPGCTFSAPVTLTEMRKLGIERRTP